MQGVEMNAGCRNQSPKEKHGKIIFRFYRVFFFVI